MKKIKDMLQIFQKKKLNLNGFTLNFKDFLFQKFNLRKKHIYNNSLIETINTKNFEYIKIIIKFLFPFKEVN